MRQKTYSDIRPEKGYDIENVENGKCTVLFFDNIEEESQEIPNVENEETTTKIMYSYDLYVLEVTYRENLAEEIERNLENWLNKAKEEDYNEVAAEIRTKRNELLAETDKEMCIDRLGLKFPTDLSMTNIINSLKQFFEGFSDICNGKMAKYRQELRDITKQEGFPYNVVWPTKDKKEEE